MAIDDRNDIGTRRLADRQCAEHPFGAVARIGHDGEYLPERQRHRRRYRTGSRLCLSISWPSAGRGGQALACIAEAFAYPISVARV